MSMTENEALEEHKKDCRRCRDKACVQGWDCLQKKDIEVYEELLKYRTIGTIEEFKALKEKKPKKAKSNKVIFSNDSYAYCPHCKGSIEAEFMKPRNCRKCGGELDWS